MSIERIEAAALGGQKGVRHGFFTRRGGTSEGIYDSLNCGFGSNDDRDAVAENRDRVAAAMHVDTTALLTVHQIHSADCVTTAGVWAPGAAPRGDALVTDQSGIALSILTADCAPVLFADGEAGVIGAAHAGWRGALTGILEAAIAGMEALGARRKRISAAVGPCIALPSYEVGAEFRAAFADADADNDRYFAPSDREAHFRFNLPLYVADRLRAAGVGAVEELALDTYAGEQDFFSYRRTTHRGEADYGRQVSSIAIADGR